MSEPQKTSAEKTLEALKAPTKTAEEIEIDRKKELLAKVRQTRQDILLNRGKLVGENPAKMYIWANRDESNIIMRESFGYVICRDDKVKTPWRQSDGSHIRGDLVLMEINRDMAEAIALDNDLRAVEAMEGRQTAVLEAAQKMGVPTFTPR